MGKPPSLRRHRGFGGWGVVFLSLRQRLGHGICRLTLVSCSCSTVRPKAGASLGREGNIDESTHTSLPPLAHPLPPAHAMPCPPIPVSLPYFPKTQTFGNRTPDSHGPTDLPPCTCPSEPAASALRHLCPAKKEVGGAGVWQEMGTHVPDGMSLT